LKVELYYLNINRTIEFLLTAFFGNNVSYYLLNQYSILHNAVFHF